MDRMNGVCIMSGDRMCESHYLTLHWVLSRHLQVVAHCSLPIHLTKCSIAIVMLKNGSQMGVKKRTASIEKVTGP